MATSIDNAWRHELKPYTIEINGKSLDAFQCQIAYALQLYTELQEIRHYTSTGRRLYDLKEVQSCLELCALRQLGFLEEADQTKFKNLLPEMDHSLEEKYFMLFENVKSNPSHWSSVGRLADRLCIDGKPTLQQRYEPDW